MKKIVVLSGSGISAESGLKTFRETGGLWEEYDVMEVASIEGWMKNPKLVLEFYNARRKQLATAKPNAAHTGLAELEQLYDVQIITQNVDNLHEQAGSTHVIHLHGELTKVKCTGDEEIVSDIGTREINWGDTCENGHQLRPDIVWFGEPVPAIETAAILCQQADIMVVVGTSLNVYPAAGLLHYVPKDIPVFLIDPHDLSTAMFQRKFEIIKEKASIGVTILKEKLKMLESHD